MQLTTTNTIRCYLLAAVVMVIGLTDPNPVRVQTFVGWLVLGTFCTVMWKGMKWSLRDWESKNDKDGGAP